MRFSAFRTLLVALVAVMAASFTSTARADTGTVRITFIKAGWVIGGTIGQGTLTYRGRTYPLSIGGLSWGLTFGGAAYAHSRILIQVHLVSFGPPHAAISHPLSNGRPCDERKFKSF